MDPDHDRRIALAVRRACVRAAREAHDDAGMAGLCAEGRWEAALGAVGRVDLDAVLRALAASEPDDAPEP